MQISATSASSYAPAAAQSPAAATPANSKPGSDAVADFLNFVGKTPAEQMRAEILHELGLTEDDLKAMDPKERLKLEDKIKSLIKDKVEASVEKKTGVAIDIKV